MRSKKSTEVREGKGEPPSHHPICKERSSRMHLARTQSSFLNTSSNGLVIAIDARRQFAACFQTQAVDQATLQESNERHTYFIQNLEERTEDTGTPMYVTASSKGEC